MHTRNRTTGPAPVRLRRLLLAPLVVLSVLGASVMSAATATDKYHPGAKPDAGPAATRYNLVPLSDDPFAFNADINSRGQVAFTELFELPDPGAYRARFYDDRAVRSPGNFGGLNSWAFAVNELGQVTGFAQSASFADHAFRWSRERGLVDLNLPGMGNSLGIDINNRGDVAGAATYASQADALQATRWRLRGGATNLNPVPGLRSFAWAINDAGTVVGWTDSTSGQRPFRWTDAGGLQLLGTYGSASAQAVDINAAGYVVGNLPFREGGPDHAFLWTPSNELIDLTPGAGYPAGATGINDKGTVIGFLNNLPAYFRGFAWSYQGGLVEIGSGRSNSSAVDLNNRGQVVGSIDGRAYVWTQAGGVVDLNARVQNAPQGLVLRDAQAIGDNGSIVASTNTGLVLLTTQAVSNQRPLAGPIVVTGRPRPGVALTFSVAFTDADPRDTHTAVWDWGEGDPSTERGIVTERNGSGRVTGQHAFPEGEFTIRLTITDSSGKRTTVRYELIVPPENFVVGQGTFLSLPGAAPLAGARPGIASFAFMAPGKAGSSGAKAAGKVVFRFRAAGLRFRSDRLDGQELHGGLVRYRGSGSLNGARGYRFAVSAYTGDSARSGSVERVHLRIWHRDARGTDVVDYDNLGAHGAGARAHAAEGAVVLQQE